MTSSIDNYNYLHGVLMLYYPTEYEYFRDCLIKKDIIIQSSGTIADRIYAYIKKLGRPVHKKELKKYFIGFSDSMIFTPISNDSRLIQWEYNYFTIMDLIDITFEDRKNLERLIKKLFDENKGYSSAIMLYNSVQREYPTFLEKNNIKSAMNLYYIVGQLFSDQCDFRRPHIGMKDKFEKFTVKEVALHLLGNPEVLLYSDYTKIAERMCWPAVTVGIVFADIEKDYVRVTQNKYIKKQSFRIKQEDIHAIFRIVCNHMENDVFAIQNYEDIEEFPIIGYEWNEFLLGSILDSYIDDIRVIQPIMKDRRYQKGIAVKSNSGLKSYPEVVAYVMISNNIESLSESQFLSFLLIHGLARKTIPQELRNSEYINFDNGRYKVIL